MKVAIAANKVGQELKDCVKAYLTKKGYEMVNLSDDDIFTATTNVVRAIQEQGITRGIVCAPTYEDYTSSMTRHHNSTQIIALAANITAPVLSCQLAENFCKTEYDGGHHQIRIDMMNRLL